MSGKVIGVIVLLVFLVIFAIQNTQPVTVKFLAWAVESSAVLTVLVSFLVGFLVGWLVWWTAPSRPPKEPTKKTPTP
jgi:uncharacterized integral membrane protein